jgi:tetratricopeptide (TPR) repeat protein
VLRRALNLAIETEVGTLSPLLTLGALGALPVALCDGRRMSRHGAGLLAAAGAWVATIAAVAVFLEYRPHRHFTIVYPPLAILAGYAVSRLLDPKPGLAPPGKRAPGVPRVILSAASIFVLTYVSVSLLGCALSALVSPPPILGVLFAFEVLLCWSAAGALLFAAGMLRERPLSERLRRALGIFAVALSASTDVPRSLAHFRPAPPRSLVESGEAVSRALGEQALLVGPYAPALGLGSTRRWLFGSTWFLIGSGATIEQLRTLGATHLVIDPEQAGGRLLEEWLKAADAKPVLLDTLVIRMQPVLMYRFSWAEGAGYRRSAFELARDAELQGDTERALVLYREAAQTGGACALLGLARVARASGELREALAATGAAVATAPSSSRAWLLHAEVLAESGDLRRAARSAERAFELESSQAILERLAKVMSPRAKTNR